MHVYHHARHDNCTRKLLLFIHSTAKLFCGQGKKITRSSKVLLEAVEASWRAHKHSKPARCRAIRRGVALGGASAPNTHFAYGRGCPSSKSFQIRAGMPKFDDIFEKQKNITQHANCVPRNSYTQSPKYFGGKTCFTLFIEFPTRSNGRASCLARSPKPVQAA